MARLAVVGLVSDGVKIKFLFTKPSLNTLRRKTGWLGTECGDMSTRGLLFQFTNTIYSSSIKQTSFQ